MSDAPRVIDTAIDIIAPENIAFNYRVAGPFRRVFAFLIDLTVQGVIYTLMYILLTLLLLISVIASFVAGMQALLGFQLGVSAYLLFAFFLHWFYGGIFEAFMNGQTPGKWLLGLRVLGTDGRPIGAMQAVVRNLARLPDLMPLLSLEIFGIPMPAYIIPTGTVGLIAMAMNPRFQRLGDLICGTMVVIEDRFWLQGVARVDDPRAIQLAAFLPPDMEVTRTMAKALSIYVERRQYFSHSRRREIAHHLGEPLLRRFGLRADTSHDLLLCAMYYRVFIADRRDDERYEREASGSPFGGNAHSPASPHPDAFIVTQQ